ncbi:MAG: hypothetical protein ACW97W_18430 [Candidatus Hodarchaeales archaeon]
MRINKDVIIVKFRLGVFYFGIISTLQFFVLSFTAMMFYPGGYSFFSDPLSALGFTRVSGEPNVVSSVIFNLSMFLVGISVILLFTAMLPFFNQTTISHFFSLTGAVFAIFSGIAMCGAALTPGDINFEAHVSFAPFTFLFGFLMIFCFTLVILLEKDFPNRYGIVLVIYELSAAISIIFLIIGTGSDTLEGTKIQIISQKIGIYAEIITLLILSYGAVQQMEVKRKHDIIIPS